MAKSNAIRPERHGCPCRRPPMPTGLLLETICFNLFSLYFFIFSIAFIPCGSGHRGLTVGFLAFPDLLRPVWPGPYSAKVRGTKADVKAPPGSLEE